MSTEPLPSKTVRGIVKESIAAGFAGLLTYGILTGRMFFKGASPVFAVAPGLATLVLLIDIVDMATTHQDGLFDTMANS